MAPTLLLLFSRNPRPVDGWQRASSSLIHSAIGQGLGHFVSEGGCVFLYLAQTMIVFLLLHLWIGGGFGKGFAAQFKTKQNPTYLNVWLVCNLKHTVTETCFCFCFFLFGIFSVTFISQWLSIPCSGRCELANITQTIKDWLFSVSLWNGSTVEPERTLSSSLIFWKKWSLREKLWVWLNLGLGFTDPRADRRGTVSPSFFSV